MSWYSDWLSQRAGAASGHDLLEAVAEAVEAGQLSPAEATHLARSEAAPQLDLESVGEGAERQSSIAISGDWQTPLVYFRLLFEAIAAREPGPERDAMNSAAVIPYLYAAGAACDAIPDGRVFTDARERGEALASELLAASETAAAGEVLHRLGVLHLDPFCGGRTHNFHNEDRIWRARLATFHGADVASREEAAMPATETAVESAIGYFERALGLRSGAPRGFTLKALAQALLWRERLGGPSDAARVVALINEALPLMPEDYQLELHQLARASGHEVAPSPAAGAAIEELFETAPEDLIRAVGLRRAADRYQIAIESLAQELPREAMLLVERLWPHLEGDEWADDRNRLAMSFGKICLVIAEQAGCTMGPEESIEEAYDRMRAQAGSWPAIAVVAVIAGLATSTQRFDREAEGVGLIDAALRHAREYEPQVEGPLTLLRAALLQGAGVNFFHAGDYGAATSAYFDAVSAYAEADQLDQALSALAAAQDSAGRAGGSCPELVVGLAHATPGLTAAGPVHLAKQLRTVWEATVAQALQLDGPTHGLNLELCWLAIQASKGADFAARVAAPTGYDWRSDPAALAQLERIGELRARIPEEHEFHTRLTDEMLLSSYGSSDADDESGEQAQLRRLRQRFDQHLLRRSRAASGALEAFRPIDEVRALLDPETVFLSQYLGRTLRGELALITFILTQEDEFLTYGSWQDLPAASIVASADGREAEMSWLAMSVAALRDEVQREPGPEAVSLEGLQSLEQNFHRHFGGTIPAKLDELYARGKRHLCIQPHDALHFHPQHLIETGDGPLAERWTVTYVPHVALLQRRRGSGDDSGLVPVTALGLGYANGEPHGQRPLPGAAGEARAIAKTGAGAALEDAEVTEAALHEALASSRYLHIACHGKLDPAAPAFQCLFLQPDGDADGLFNAYELVGRDLGHLDLVTLSACETALGRFDPLDNLRGFSAGLFAAGARTVVSTLWPVVDEVSRSFFTTLYQRLAAGSGKLAAFREAQTRTRASFPQYRDWGAFHFGGAW